MHAIARLGLGLLLGVSVTACGFKGPLVLPDKKPAATAATTKPDTEQTNKSR